MSTPKREKKRGPGRPSVVTPEAIEKLCQALSAGNWRRVAAEWAGMSYRVFSEWMQRGKRQARGKYRNFRRQVLEAEKRAEIRAVGIVMQAAQQDARHAEWWLERKLPMRWGRRMPQAIELSGHRGAPLNLFAGMTADQLMELAKRG